MSILSGSLLGPYEVLAPLGEGGMGQVYKARDTRLNRDVAIKVLPDRFANDAARERFQREARVASALSHPKICAIYDVGVAEGQPYRVMELLEGQTLRDRIGGHPLDLETLLALGIQIADALDAAHSKGIITATSSRPTFSSRRAGTPRCWISAWPSMANRWFRRRQRHLDAGDPHHSWDDAGHGGVYVAGTGARARRGCTHRSVVLWSGALRDGHRKAAVRRSHQRGDL